MVKTASPLSGDRFDSSYYCNRYCNQILPIFTEIFCLFLIRRDGERIGEDILQRITAFCRYRAEFGLPPISTGVRLHLAWRFPLAGLTATPHWRGLLPTNSTCAQTCSLLMMSLDSSYYAELASGVLAPGLLNRCSIFSSPSLCWLLSPSVRKMG